MSRSASSFLTHLGSLLPALVLFTLLGVLASLQVRWLEQMRATDDERSRADLEARIERVAEGFNRQLGRLFVELQPLRRRSFSGFDQTDELAAFLAELLAGWGQQADYPDMVKTAYLLSPEADEQPPSEVWRLEPLERVSRQEVPTSLLAAIDAVAKVESSRRGSPLADADAPSLLLADVPAMLIPLATPPTRFGEPRASADEAERKSRTWRRAHRRSRAPIVAILLDPNVLTAEVLPELVEGAFGEQLDFNLRLIEKKTGRLVLALGPPAPRAATVDARVELFGPLSTDRRRTRGRGGRPPFDAKGLDRGQWLLQASHPAGSLAESIAGAHRRNLATSLGILAVLGASLIVLTRGAARSRRLAGQQLDFVAGITHELMTPLAALRSAGQNLADGVVQESEQVERYGRMIDREGHRLSDLVGQVLAFSHMQSGPAQFRPQPLDSRVEIQAVLEEMRPTLEAASIALELDFIGEPAEVLADSQALRRALSNLISNAVKYGQVEGQTWLGITLSSDGDDVVFEVADRGRGIASRDRAHLFEPFYRGSGLAAGRIPGSGLGLALVHHLIEGQSGRVEVHPHRPGTDYPGAAFTLRLPAVRSGFLKEKA